MHNTASEIKSRAARRSFPGGEMGKTAKRGNGEKGQGTARFETAILSSPDTNGEAPSILRLILIALLV